MSSVIIVNSTGGVVTNPTEDSIMIRQAMDRISADPSKIQMGKKTYTTVASRIEAMRFVYGESISIETEVLVHPEWRPGIQTNDSVIVVRASVLDATGRILSTGHAEEVRGSNRMTETSALEVCETSAIGRALASLGLHGGEYASAQEIEIAERKRSQGTARGVQKGSPGKDSFGEYVEQDGFATVPDKDRGPAGGGANATPKAVAGAGSNGTSGLGVLDQSGAVTALEAFKVFAQECESTTDLRQFWTRNKKVLEELKDASPEKHAEVKDIFMKREKELKGA